MEEFQKKGEDINKSLTECRRKLAEMQKKLQEMKVSTSDDAKAELSKVQAEEKKLRKEEREWEKKMDEFNREEKKMPWNVDTLSKDGFSKVIKQIVVMVCFRLIIKIFNTIICTLMSLKLSDNSEDLHFRILHVGDTKLI